MKKIILIMFIFSNICFGVTKEEVRETYRYFYKDATCNNQSAAILTLAYYTAQKKE